MENNIDYFLLQKFNWTGLNKGRKLNFGENRIIVILNESRWRKKGLFNIKIL